MSRFSFVTSNSLKIKNARLICDSYGITFETEHFDATELQDKDGANIARSKARQAFETFKKPIVITDDSWLIPGLNDFPGPYMKQMNEWLTPQDFLRLTQHLKDRRIVKQQFLVYKDKDFEKLFCVDVEATLLLEARGASPYSHLTITSYDGVHSLAENDDIAPAVLTKRGSWHELCEWLTQ